MSRAADGQGERNTQAKLTPQQVIDMRAEFSARVVTYKMLAERHGMSEGAVKDAVQGRTWAHIPGARGLANKRPPSSEEWGSGAPTTGAPSGRDPGGDGGPECPEPTRLTGTAPERRRGPLRQCRISGCESPVRSDNMCDKHRQQARRKYGHLVCAVEGCSTRQYTGSTSKTLLPRGHVAGHRGNQLGRKGWFCQEHERLLLDPPQWPWIGAGNLDMLSQNIQAGAGGCWVWKGPLSPEGYGRFVPHGGGDRPWVAHRALFDLLVGGHKHGLQLDHRCGKRACVAPHHLRPVTASANSRRRGKPVTDPTDWKVLVLPDVQSFAWKHALPGRLWT